MVTYDVSPTKRDVQMCCDSVHDVILSDSMEQVLCRMEYSWNDQKGERTLLVSSFCSRQPRMNIHTNSQIELNLILRLAINLQFLLESVCFISI